MNRYSHDHPLFYTDRNIWCLKHTGIFFSDQESRNCHLQQSNYTYPYYYNKFNITHKPTIYTVLLWQSKKRKSYLFVKYFIEVSKQWVFTRIKCVMPDLTDI